jgi:hypothetical protein
MKHLLGIMLFVLIVGVSFYFYTPSRPVPPPPGPAFVYPPTDDKVASSVILDLPRREVYVSFTLPESAPDTLWARVEFFSLDDGSPPWATLPTRIASTRQASQVKIAIPCGPCSGVSSETSYYARIIVSGTPDGDTKANALVPVLIKHQ